MDKRQIETAISKAMEEKGKRKFTQSVDAIFNFRGLDMTKPENRVNIDINLPKGRGKEVPVIVFAEQAMALDAQKAGATQVYDAAGIAKLATDKKAVKKMAGSSEFIAAPGYMITIGKTLGQTLGAKNKLPRPIVGNVAEAVKMAKNRVRMASRGKYLPTTQVAIGSETMSISDLVENFEAAYDKVKNKAGESTIASVYVKLSMGKAVKLTSQKSEEKQ